MTITPEVLVAPFKANTSTEALAPKTVVLSNGNLLVAYILRRARFAASGTVPEAENLIRGQQFDSAGNKIGGQVVFDFPAEIDTVNMDIIALEDRHVAILVDQDFSATLSHTADITTPLHEISSERDRPVVCVFRISETGNAEINIDRSQIVEGSGVGLKHFDFALANAGNNGWRSHAIGRFGLGFLLQRDTIRQDSHTDDDSITARLGLKRGINDTLESTALTRGRVALLHHDNRESSGLGLPEDLGLGRFNVHIIGSDGETDKTLSVDVDSDKNFEGAIQGLKSGRFVVAWSEDDDRDTDVKFQLFRSSGTTVRKGVLVGNTGLSDNNREPSIAPLQDGGFIITYKRRGAANIVPTQLRGQRYDGNGNPVGAVFFIEDNFITKIDSALLDDGRVAVTYESGLDVKALILGTERTPAITGSDEEDVPGLART